MIKRFDPVFPLFCMVLMSILACGKVVKQKPPAQVSDNLPAMDVRAYQSLLAQSPAALARKAAAGELGNCVGEYKKAPTCASGYAYQLRLRNIDQNFSLMDNAPGSNCEDNIPTLILEALKTGVCFYVNLPLDQLSVLSEATLARRAFYGTLGFCKLQKLNSMLCSTGSTYGLYLLNKEKYFPHMSIEPDPLGCFSEAGLTVKDALMENYCL